MASDDKKTISDEGIDLEVHQIDIQLKREGQQLGVLGKIFGSRDHAPTNVAGGITLLLLLLMAAVLIWGGNEKLDILNLMGGFLLAALGYLFGAASRGN